MYKLKVPLLIFLLIGASPSAFSARFGLSPEAHDDNGAMIIGATVEMTGNVQVNDFNGDVVDFTNLVGHFGFLSSVDSSGDFTYTLHSSVTTDSLTPGEVAFDIFPYTLINTSTRQTSSANLIIELSTVNIPRPAITSNVDIEFNDRSAQATPLNSGKSIVGQLHNSSDKDWFSLASAGNEIISIEVCPQNTSCFGKKSWVLYVFDSDRLTLQMEETNFIFSQFLDETGGTRDEIGKEIISGFAGESNHMYLAYRTGVFNSALIGVVDPCFDTNNTVNIGVGDGARNYFIAISSPLAGDADASSGDNVECGQGSIILTAPGSSAFGSDAEGAPKTYDTTVEFISIFPNSDDQYSITITGTGINPLLSDEAAARSATFNSDTGELILPKVRVFNDIFEAKLSIQNIESRSLDTEGGMRFGLTGLGRLNTTADAYQSTYNPENNQVTIPRLTDLSDGKAYSMVLLYHPPINGNIDTDWLEVIDTDVIQ